jgi:hypothetical protein
LAHSLLGILARWGVFLFFKESVDFSTKPPGGIKTIGTPYNN